MHRAASRLRHPEAQRKPASCFQKTPSKPRIGIRSSRKTELQIFPGKLSDGIRRNLSVSCLLYTSVKESSSREEAAKRLSRWIMDAQKSGLMEFIKVSFTYQNWSKEILNSFEYPYTNGYIEGCNNRIKVLKRISFGMPRFVRFRRRIMHIMLN